MEVVDSAAGAAVARCSHHLFTGDHWRHDAQRRHHKAHQCRHLLRNSTTVSSSNVLLFVDITTIQRIVKESSIILLVIKVGNWKMLDEEVRSNCLLESTLT